MAEIRIESKLVGGGAGHLYLVTLVPNTLFAAVHIAACQGFVRKSGLRYHRDVGLVGDVPQKILRRLMKILK